MLQLVHEDATLVTTAAPSVSGWENLSDFDELVIAKTHTGGTYALAIDWSNDGSTVDVTETVTVTNNDSVTQPVAGKFARFRISVTTANMTAHRTSIYGKYGAGRTIPVTELSGNVAVGTPLVSGWVRVADYEKVRLAKTSAGGTYGCEIDWSSDGETADQTETVTVPNNDQVEEVVKGAFMRARVTATGTPLTSHITTVVGIQAG